VGNAIISLLIPAGSSRFGANRRIEIPNLSAPPHLQRCQLLPYHG
jgi:hypothetical protein